jgi:putative SOS response-associated peptidase YedK
MTRDGEVIAAAGLWGKWTGVKGKRVAERVESFCVFTVKDDLEEWQPLILERFDWQSWLEGSVGIDELAAMPPAHCLPVLNAISNDALASPSSALPTTERRREPVFI